MYYILSSIVFLLSVVNCELSQSYSTQRSEILEQEYKLSLEGNATLNDKEDEVNKCLVKYKTEEFEYGIRNPQYYNFSHHFFQYKENMKRSKVYKIIKSMPKGALLHIHDMAMLGPDYLLNITYEENLYACFDDPLRFRFSRNTPVNITCDAQWKLVSDARRDSKDVETFDKELKEQLTIVTNDPDILYPTVVEVWRGFQKYFSKVGPLITYKPIWEKYLYNALKKMREDNVTYVEMRTIFRDLYNLDDAVENYDPLRSAKICKQIIYKFKKEHPDFIGAKFIYAPWRNLHGLQLEESIEHARVLKRELPEIFAGFDLIGQEDTGAPLILSVPQLEAAKDLNFFLHAGETDWYGTAVDENLVDAILLGAKRIGHGYALPKHPVLMKEVKDRDIGVEVNVISNAVLSLVRDVRNHPLNILLANGVPVVLSSDDPGVWDVDALTDDFYVAFMGVASKRSDLKLLKTLAINSLRYSALDSEDKQKALNDFDFKWNEFVDKFDCNSYL